MTEPVTQVTMWQDAQGVAWPSELQAQLANNTYDLTAFLSTVAASGAVLGMEDCNAQQLATAILASYTVAPIAPPAPAPAPSESPSPSPAPAPQS